MSAEPIGVLLKHISRVVEMKLSRKAEQLGLTSTQLFTLHYLCKIKEKTICQRDIEEKFDLSHSTVSGIIARLEAKKFIICSNYSKDKRFKNISVTEKAIECDEEMHKYIINTETELFEGFSDSEKEIFISLLHRIIENLKLEIPRPCDTKEEE